MKRTMYALCGLVAACCIASDSRADLLNLSLLPSPDITSAFIDVDYDAGSGTFTASGFALNLFDGGSNHAISDGVFALSASIDGSGNATGGTLQIAGNITGFGGPDLLTGSLIDFGFQPGGGDLFEFLFVVTGGDLSSDYGGVGGEFGVILNANGSTFNGDWGLSFNNNGGKPGSGMGVSDTAPIPAPAALPLLLGGAFLARRRRS